MRFRSVPCALLLCAVLSLAQQRFPSKFSLEIARRPDVAGALQYIDQHRDEQLAEWIRITEIPAPSRMEQKRADYIKGEMEKAGLTAMSTDEMGNVTGVRQGSGGGPAVVFAAHMDTVFPADTVVKVRRDGNTLRAPGVGDNSASVANMLAAIRAMASAGIRTKGDLIFVATVQEEIGLKGMQFWLEHNRNKVDLLVALDGSLPVINYGALGIKWTRFVYTSPGSHTNASRGKPNPAKAIARAIQNIYAIPLPPTGAESTAIYNVGMIGGGRIFNSISQESFFTVDLRSTDPLLLKELDGRIRRVAEDAAKEEKVGFHIEMETDQPAGGTRKQLESKRAHPIVQTAVDILSYLDVEGGKPVRAGATGSTDANVGVTMGIPSIAVGRARGDGAHTLDEHSDIDSAYLGTKQIVLLAASLAE